MYTKRRWYLLFKNEEGEELQILTSPYSTERNRELEEVREELESTGWTFLREECEVVKVVR